MTLHTKISYIKSGVRIVGFAFLAVNPIAAALILVIAEAIGIWEEMAPNAYVGTEGLNSTPNYTTVPSLPGPYVVNTGKIACQDDCCTEPTLRETGFNDPPTLR